MSHLRQAIREELDRVKISRLRIVSRHRWMEPVFNSRIFKLLIMPIIQYSELLGQKRMGEWVLTLGEEGV